MINRDFLMGYGAGKQAGGGVEVEALSVTQNDTYTAPEGKAYSPITVAVPNTYAAGDEGKVVSGGALVSQSSATYTQNDTYDTTLKNSVTVNVPNTYAAADEGKVVSSGALVAQTSATYTENDTYDTTLINAVTVNVAGAQNVATGEITFAEKQSVAPPSASKYIITHNLGRTPQGLAWVIVNGTATSGIYVSGENAITTECIAPNKYIRSQGSSSGSTTLKGIIADTTNVWNSLDANESTITLFTAAGSRASAAIGAGMTIRWFVW